MFLSVILHNHIILYTIQMICFMRLILFGRYIYIDELTETINSLTLVCTERVRTFCDWTGSICDDVVCHLSWWIHFLSHFAHRMLPPRIHTIITSGATRARLKIFHMLIHCEWNLYIMQQMLEFYRNDKKCDCERVCASVCWWNLSKISTKSDFDHL